MRVTFTYYLVDHMIQMDQRSESDISYEDSVNHSTEETSNQDHSNPQDRMVPANPRRHGMAIPSQ